MFSKELELSISQAYQEAREKRHEFLTVEHMLLALLDNASALSILSACDADIAALERDIRKVLEDTVPVLKEDEAVIRSQRSGSSGYCSERCTTSSLPEKTKYSAPMCWSPYSVKKIHTPVTC